MSVTASPYSRHAVVSHGGRGQPCGWHDLQLNGKRTTDMEVHNSRLYWTAMLWLVLPAESFAVDVVHFNLSTHPVSIIILRAAGSAWLNDERYQSVLHPRSGGGCSAVSP